MSDIIELDVGDEVRYSPLRPPQGGKIEPKHKALLMVAPNLRYQKAWDIQNELHERRKQDRIPDVLILTDHTLLS